MIICQNVEQQSEMKKIEFGSVSFTMFRFQQKKIFQGTVICEILPYECFSALMHE